jgi:RNase P subunit RPR2
MIIVKIRYCTHGHTRLRIGDPVRSRIHKQSRDQLVVGWVTTSES